MIDDIDLSKKLKQKEFGDLVGISQAAVSELITKGVLFRGQTGLQWLHSYCGHLREVAAGRIGAGNENLVGERARLAREQADRIALQNAQTRNELAPMYLLEEVLTKAATKVCGILDAIPGMLKRRTGMTASQLDLVAGEIAKARNMMATASLKDVEALSMSASADEHGDDGETGGNGRPV